MSIWKQVPLYPDYQVSILGEVLSLKKATPLILKQSNDGKGYKVVNLDGELTFVHRIVGAAFLGLKLDDPKQCIMHLDDNPANNNLYNLRLGTQLDNIRDMHKKGRNVLPKAKITFEIALKIRERRGNGETGTSLAKEYNVSESLIANVNSGRRWNK